MFKSILNNHRKREIKKNPICIVFYVRHWAYLNWLRKKYDAQNISQVIERIILCL